MSASDIRDAATGDEPGRGGAAGSAVARLLERAPAREDLAAAAARLAAGATPQRGDDASAFVFRLGEEWLGLATALVDEVLELRPVHRLPHRRDAALRGLVNVRGRLTVCVALPALLQTGPAPAARGGARRLVVLAAPEGALAFEADEVHGSLRYPLEDVRAVPSTVAHAVARFATGVLPWGERRIGLLDADLLLHALDRRIS